MTRHLRVYKKRGKLLYDIRFTEQNLLWRCIWGLWSGHFVADFTVYPVPTVFYEIWCQSLPESPIWSRGRVAWGCRRSSHRHSGYPRRKDSCNDVMVLSTVETGYKVAICVRVNWLYRVLHGNRTLYLSLNNFFHENDSWILTMGPDRRYTWAYSNIKIIMIRHLYFKKPANLSEKSDSTHDPELTRNRMSNCLENLYANGHMGA